MFKDYLMKKAIKSQMKDIPPAAQEQMLKLVSENPELFQKIALEVQEEMKKGKDRMTATMEVAKKHEEELKRIM